VSRGRTDVERAQVLTLIHSAAPAVAGVPEAEMPALRDALDAMPLAADMAELQFLRQLSGALELHCKHLAAENERLSRDLGLASLAWRRRMVEIDRLEAENARLQEENHAARNLIAITLSGRTGVAR
jgi:hypothetical protein